MFGMRRWNRQSILPSRFAISKIFPGCIFISSCPRFGEPARLGWLGLRNNLVLKLGERGEKFAGFKWLDNESVGPHPSRIIGLERLKLADGEQHRDSCGIG